MYATFRTIAGLIVLGLAVIAVVFTPAEARIFTVLGAVIVALFLLGLEKLLRALLGFDQ